MPNFILWYNIMNQNEVVQNKKGQNHRNQKAVVKSVNIPDNWFEKFFESSQLLTVGLFFFNTARFFLNRKLLCLLVFDCLTSSRQIILQLDLITFGKHGKRPSPLNSEGDRFVSDQ